MCLRREQMKVVKFRENKVKIDEVKLYTESLKKELFNYYSNSLSVISKSMKDFENEVTKEISKINKRLDCLEKKLK